MARITTRQEEARQSLDLTMGFIPHQFNYTRTYLNRSQLPSKYGKFMAKVRFSATYPAVSPSGWPVEDYPHIDIVKTAYKKVTISSAVSI